MEKDLLIANKMLLNMLESGLKVNVTEMVFQKIMEIFMKENFLMIKLKVKEKLLIKVDLFMTENGKKEKSKVLD